MSNFSFMPKGTVKLQGVLGEVLNNTIMNRLLKLKYSYMVDPFRFRNEDDGRWRCEFWGKVVRSAIWILRSQYNAELEKEIRATVADMLSVQTPDGCISSYPADKQLSEWDIWGRKYVMIGLIRYYDEIEADPAVKKALTAMLDHLIAQLNGRPVCAFGNHLGLASCSILGAIVGVYRITGEKRFLDFAKEIVDSGCCSAHNIFEEARKGTPPSKIGTGKAYEMMSCYQGLADYYVYDPKPEYAEAIEKFFAMVRDQEIFITGGGGMGDWQGEFWANGKYNQTKVDKGALGETCVFVTYMHLCDSLFRLTGNVSAEQELHHTTYNGLLGAVSNDGRFWCHANPTPLSSPSSKVATTDHMSHMGTDSFHNHDCCLAQGPEGIALAALHAVMKTKSGLLLNTYEPLTVDLSPVTGKTGTLKIEGKYPFAGAVKITLQLASDTAFDLTLRIPVWQTMPLTIQAENNAYTAENAGDFFTLSRTWKNGDVITFQLDENLRLIPSPDGEFSALAAGALILARESRIGNVNAPIPADLKYKECEPVHHLKMIRELSDGSMVCDYLSAGGGFVPGNLLRVWLDTKKDE